MKIFIKMFPMFFKSFMDIVKSRCDIMVSPKDGFAQIYWGDSSKWTITHAKCGVGHCCNLNIRFATKCRMQRHMKPKECV